MGDPLTPVHWKEGLFLRPHHLQQNSIYTTQLLGHHLATISPYSYGVRAVEVDEGRLEEGVFVLRRLEFHLPSGEVAQFPGNTKLSPRKIVEPGPGRESRMKVFFGVRRLRDQEPNLSREGPEDPDPARYVADRRLVYEKCTGRDSQELEFEFLNGRIFFEDESMEDFDAFPIAELVPPEVGLPLSRISKDFVPPCVKCGASDVLSNMIRQLHAASASKAGRLAARADAEGVRASEAIQGDVLSLWKLHTIHGYLPYLREAVEVGATHPYPLYIEVARFAGQLASFSTAMGSFELPAYDHQDPGRCFGEVVPMIHRMMEELVPSNFARVPLEQDGFRFTGDLREEWLTLNNRFYICVRTDLPEALVERWFRATTKISARSKIDAIVERRLKGVPTVRCEKPRVLPPRDGYTYFELQRDAADWNDVQNSRTVAIHLSAEAGMTPEALASVIMELNVVFGG